MSLTKEALDAQLKQRLTAMYLSAMTTPNFDTGRKDPPIHLEKALGYHLPAVRQLIAETIKEITPDKRPSGVVNYRGFNEAIDQIQSNTKRILGDD
jgi:hypothetical protein